MSDFIQVTDQDQNQNQNQNESIGVDLPLAGLALSRESIPRRPLGVSPSLERFGPGDTFRGQKWPSLPEPRKLSYVPRSEVPGREGEIFFPGSPWTAEFYPIVILSEFVGRPVSEFVERPAWREIDVSSHLEKANLHKEIQELEEIMDYRPGVTSEALAQCNGIVDYFQGILSFSSTSHPMTYGLAVTAIRVGEFQVMYHKIKYNRPRPSRLSPRLMPLIEVPGHASYPSGHATQSRLVAKCLEKVMPEQAHALLFALADRIARNREVMGLHYPSDSAAGKELANKTIEILSKCPTVACMIEKGRQEWGR